MKVTKQYLKKLIMEELTQEVSAPAPMQEAAGGVVYLVGVDIPHEPPLIYGAFSDKKAALKGAKDVRKMMDQDGQPDMDVGFWVITIDNILYEESILNDTFQPL